jgi:hypothetical protein
VVDTQVSEDIMAEAEARKAESLLNWQLMIQFHPS